MSGIAYRSLVAEGDRWLEQAVDTFRGGGDFSVASAQAAIASAYYGRASLDKPDTFASLMSAAQAAKGAQPPTVDEIDAAIARHPAGRARNTVTDNAKPKEGPTAS